MDLASSILLLLLTCVAMQALHFLLRRSRKPGYKLPPGPTPIPIIGNLLQIGKKPHLCLAELAKIHGPVMRLKLGQATTIVISSVEVAKEVLQANDQVFSDRPLPQSIFVHNHEQYSLAFLPVSPLWRDQRRICNNQLFANKSLDANQDLRRKKVQEMLNDIHASSQIGEAVDIGKAAFKATFNLLSSTFFSVDFVHSVGEAGEYRNLAINISIAIGTPNLADFFPVLKKFDPNGIRRRTAIYVGKLFNIFEGLINQRLKQREGTGFVTNNDMLDALLNVSKENSQEMDKEKIKHLFHDLLLAGTDTTAFTLEWAMAELLRNSKTMSKAKKELDQAIGIGNPVEESDIARLPYLQAIIKETLRLHPPAPMLLPRKAKTDVTISGYTIPKGAQVLIHDWAIGRDPSVWENPNLFSPERFLGSEIDLKGRNFELVPFGSGRRICPGLPLAIRMLHLMLGSLINSFDWKLEDDMKPEDMDMDDAIQGNGIKKGQPLRVIPIKRSN